MTQSKETGHAINVANANKLRTACEGFGPTFDPPRANMQTNGLQTMHQTATNHLNNVIAAKTDSDTAINSRKISFSKVRKIIILVAKLFAICGASAEAIADLNLIKKKILGVRVGKLKPTAEGETPNTISVSQTGMENLIMHLSACISIIDMHSAIYTPNEPEATLTGLEALRQELILMNNNAISAQSALSNARAARNNALYAPFTGLVDVANATKAYIRMKYGINSPEYKQVKGLKFKQLK